MSFMLLGILNSQVDAGGTPAFELISTQVLSTTTATVTFSSIPATYKHLQLRMVVRNPTGFDSLFARFNSDTGSNYSDHNLNGDGSSVSSVNNINQTYMRFGVSLGGGSYTNQAGLSVVDILDYTNTSKNTTARASIGYGSGVQLNSGLWRNTAAITTITLLGQSYSFAAASRFSLYGIRG